MNGRIVDTRSKCGGNADLFKIVPQRHVAEFYLFRVFQFHRCEHLGGRRGCIREINREEQYHRTGHRASKVYMYMY